MKYKIPFNCEKTQAYLFSSFLAYCILLVPIFTFSQIKTDSLQIVQLLQKEGLAWRMGDKEAHHFGKQVKLRLVKLETRNIIDLTPVFFGGQGTINVPSWSPDSQKVAFVSYAF